MSWLRVSWPYVLLWVAINSLLILVADRLVSRVTTRLDHLAALLQQILERTR